MIPGDTKVIIKYGGLVPVSSLVNRPSFIWSGHEWVESKIKRSIEEYVLRIKLSDGTILHAPPYAAVLVAGDEDYYWKEVSELQSGEHLCNCLGVKSVRQQTIYSSPSFWYGCIFANGYKYGHIIKLVLPTYEENMDDVLRALERISTHIGSTKYHARKRSILIEFNGLKLLSELLNMRADFGDDYKMVAVPSGILVANHQTRRRFCEGIINTIGDKSTITTGWNLNMETRLRAHSARQVFRSLGIEAVSTNLGGLHIPKWLASLELHTFCRYPLWTDLVQGKSAPYNVMNELMKRSSRAVNGFQWRKWSSGLLLRLYNHYKQYNNLYIHPGAIRTGWKILRAYNKTQAYNLTPVVSISTTPTKTRLYSVRVYNQDNRVACDCYIFGDSLI